MIKRIKFESKYGFLCDIVVDMIEEDKKYIYAKFLENGHPILIDRKKIIEICEADKK